MVPLLEVMQVRVRHISLKSAVARVGFEVQSLVLKAGTSQCVLRVLSKRVVGGGVQVASL